MKAKYGLPENVVFCRRCVISNQRPNTVVEHKNKPTDSKPTTLIGEGGVCDACRYAEGKRLIDWETRRRQLMELCDRYRRDDGRPDIVIPGSGGKDSIYTAHILRKEFGMHPLTVTWSPHLYTDQGWKNLQSMIKDGYDNILISPNGEVHRLLTKLAFENLVHPFQPFVFGQKNVGPMTACRFDIPLVMYGENQAEYGNPIKETNQSKMDEAFFAVDDPEKVFLSGMRVDELQKQYHLNRHDLSLYLPYSLNEIRRKNIEVHYIGYYLPFDQQTNYYYVSQHSSFEPNPQRRDGTYSRYSSLDDKIDDLHYYATFIKFGLGKASYDAAQEIRAAHITREEGLHLVKRFDGEFPHTYHQEVLEYMGLDEGRFHEVIDQARSPHLWQRTSNGWELRHASWMSHHRGDL